MGGVQRTQVHPKAESPGDCRPRERTAHSRPGRVRERLHRRVHGDQARPLTQGRQPADESERAGRDACRSAAGNRAAEDEDGRRRRRGTDDGADLEDQDAGHVEPFLLVVQDQPGEEGLAGYHAQEVGAGVPADVVEGAEFGGDCGNRGT